MEVSDMLDVIHYFFEEDYRYASYEQAQYKDSFRSNIYKDLYDQIYKYGVADITGNTPREQARSRDFDEEDEFSLTPFDPNSKQETKPYIPPTDFFGQSAKPFGETLESPLN